MSSRVGRRLHQSCEWNGLTSQPVLVDYVSDKVLLCTPSQIQSKTQTDWRPCLIGEVSKYRVRGENGNSSKKE